MLSDPPGVQLEKKMNCMEKASWMPPPQRVPRLELGLSQVGPGIRKKNAKKAPNTGNCTKNHFLINSLLGETAIQKPAPRKLSGTFKLLPNRSPHSTPPRIKAGGGSLQGEEVVRSGAGDNFLGERGGTTRASLKRRKPHQRGGSSQPAAVF